MPKKYEPKPENGKLSKEMKNMSSKERNTKKNEEFKKLNKSKLTRGNIHIEIKSITTEKECLKVIMSAKQAGQEVKLDNPFLYINAPILVTNNTFRKETVNGEEVDRENFVEDLSKAFDDIIFESIRLSISQNERNAQA